MNLFRQKTRGPPRRIVSCLAVAAFAMQPAQWKTEYDGQGQVKFEARGLRLRPQAALLPTETHAALVLSRAAKDTRYFEVEVRFTNVASLRTVNPQPWEVFWLLFNYQPQGNEKETNYIVLKTNGVEIGRAFGKLGQKILRTWEFPRTSFGTSQKLKVRRMGTRILIEVNDNAKLVYDFSQDEEQPLNQSGTIGLYSEDAEVLIEDFVVRRI